MPYISAATFVSYRTLAYIIVSILPFITPTGTQLHTPFPHLTSSSLTDVTFQTSSTQMYHSNHFTSPTLKKSFPHILKQYCKSPKSLIVAGSSYIIPGTPAIPFPHMVHHPLRYEREFRTAISSPTLNELPCGRTCCLTNMVCPFGPLWRGMLPGTPIYVFRYTGPGHSPFS